MKKIALLIASVLCILLAAGCTDIPQRPAGNMEESATGLQSESAELAFLKSSIAEQHCMLGVGFFGYIDSESDEKRVRELVANSVLAESYPFLKDCSPVLLEGAELYAFVPASKAAAVSVYRAEPSEDGNYIDYRDTPLYSGKPGESVVLRCNLSEIHANVLISVTDGADTLEFHPFISLESGCLIQERGCYDFSVYEESEEGALEAARERLLAADEVRGALERGMKLLYTGDVQVIEGKSCPIFALGTDHEGQFVREQLYAVSEEWIYAYSPESDNWEILGVG